MRIRRAVWLGSTLICVSLATLAGGCGGDFTVSGKVKVRGQPLNGGLVTFISTHDESQKRSASIGSDGSYTMYNPPRGEVVATVKVDIPPGTPTEEEAPEPPQIQGMKLPGKGQRPPELVRIDGRYADPATSQLRYSVKHSGQKININLDD
jgi:hypothetical protein